MTTDNWINLIAAILVGGGTLSLGIMAWRTIRQTRNIQKAEKRERLLNEIIEWAINIAKCGIEKGYPDISNLIDLYSVWQKISDKIGDVILCFKEMRGKNQYIGEIIKTLDYDLGEASKTLIDDFEEHIRLLSLCETFMRDREKAWEKVVGHKHKLNFSAKKVIEEATKIKTRDIGKKEENMSKEGEATGSNEPTMKDIEEHLTRIEGHVIQSKKNAKAQAVGSFGFTGMAAGMALVVTGVQTTSGLALFSAGLILTLCSFYVKRT